jgi:hypothetical protein
MLMESKELWPEPRVTGNAALLAGYIAGVMHKCDRDGPYSVVGLNPGVEIEHENGNRYRLTVEQISGQE